MRATRQGANFIAVLVALALIFKDFIVGLAQDIFDKIQANASSAVSDL